MSDLNELRMAVNEAIERRSQAADAVEAADDDAALDTAEAALTEAEAEVMRCEKNLARQERVERAKNAEPLHVDDGKDVKVVREAPAYELGGPHSFFRDIARAGKGDQRALERLERNEREFATDHPTRYMTTLRALGIEKTVDRSWLAAEVRAGLTQTATAGGEFIPPVWYIDQYAGKLRAGRPFLNALGTKPLPAGTNSLNFPKITTGSSVAVQADAGAVSNTDLVTSSVTAQVQTEAGRTVASYQTIDLGPITDQVIMDDLSLAYDTQLDSDAINGNVANAKGLLNVTSPNTVTYTDASPTGAEFYAPVMQGASQVAGNAFVGVNLIVTRPSVWYNILAGLDGSTRPLFTAVGPGFNVAGDGTVDQGNGVIGNIGGIPVVIDANVPTNLGAGTNESRMVVLNRRGLDFWESAPRFKVADQTSIANLQYQFVMYGYYAVTSRQAKMISIISGTGLIPVTGF